jgi:hypothetical protein
MGSNKICQSLPWSQKECFLLQNLCPLPGFLRLSTALFSFFPDAAKDEPTPYVA